MQVRHAERSCIPLQERALDPALRQRLLVYFLRRVGSQSDAEDLTQEALTRLLGSDRFAQVAAEAGDDMASAFAFRVARNLLLDRARSGARWRFRDWDGDGDDPAAADVVESPDADRLLIGKESLDMVHSWLSEVDERSKGIFLLVRLGGMKQKDIARLYGVSLSTVEQALIATSAHLAQRLTRQRRRLSS